MAFFFKRLPVLLLSTLMLLIGTNINVQCEAASIVGIGTSKNVSQAKSLFKIYQRLEAEFDSRLANLYSDSAVITTSKQTPDGVVQTQTIPIERYKKMLRQLMPMAEALEDFGKYTRIDFEEVGSKVRIDAIRKSKMTQDNLFVRLLVGPDPDGRWLIFEEASGPTDK